MKQVNKFIILAIAIASNMTLFSVQAHAGNVGWNVSVGSWRPAAYGEYGPGWSGYRGYPGRYFAPYAGYYAPPPAVVYVSPPQPVVLAAQPQPPIWYYCEASGQYFPYAQECPTGWQPQVATPPTGSRPQRYPQY